MAYRLMLLSLCLLVCRVDGGEIGFNEAFALADDREVPLTELIPGTDEHYYYHCLHLQNTGDLEGVDRLVKKWVDHRRTTVERAWEIIYRQALLRYDQHPKQSLEFIRQRLGLRFNHQKETVGQASHLPTKLDAKRLSRETLLKEAYRSHGGVNDLEARAHGWGLTTQLRADDRRKLLGLLTRPDYPDLVKHIIDDLNHRHSGGFGSLGVHNKLLLSQLDDCLARRPALLNETRFVNVYLQKLQPGAGDNWQVDAAVHEAYLQRMWRFVQRLAPAHNSLKAHILYHQLSLERKRGVYDRERFMTYLQLPRHASYSNRDYFQRREFRGQHINFNAQFYGQTLQQPIRSDEPLVRDFLTQFLKDAESVEPFDTYVNDIYLKELWAETKLLYGIGDAERWYSLLSPAKVQAIKERIELSFAPGNADHFESDADVNLALDVKNVRTLIVKVYEINTDNFYREKQKEIGTDINLDGLVPNHEFVHEYTEPSVRRVRRSFPLPQLKKRGVYVVEFIGNGKSSRALVRKGTLRFVQRTGTAGHVMTVVDDQKVVKNARVWLSGHEYRAEDDGEIFIPFTEQTRQQSIILSDGELSVLARFQHLSEHYELNARFHVSREALAKRRKASILIRPQLSLNGRAVTLKDLEKVRLTLNSTDLDGIRSSAEVRDIVLNELGEYTYEFQVPQRLAHLHMALSASIKVLSQNRKQELKTAFGIQVNGIDATDKIEDMHLEHTKAGYWLHVLGKSGERRAGRPVQFRFKHQDFKHLVRVSLQSDASGRIDLGQLVEIERVEVRNQDGTEQKWTISREDNHYPAALQAKLGDTIRLPYLGAAAEPIREELSLLELRGGRATVDRFSALRIRDGYVEIDDLPLGDHQLYLHHQKVLVAIRIINGPVAAGHILGPHRFGSQRAQQALQIADIKDNNDRIAIRLTGHDASTRVHVLTTRFVPSLSPFSAMTARHQQWVFATAQTTLKTHYLSGRDIGDEYRYIIDRKYAKVFPGNMLKRPSLLLNPWALRDTSTAAQVAAQGDTWAAQGDAALSVNSAVGAGRTIRRPAVLNFSNFDFLGAPTPVLSNLRANEQGIVEIKRNDLGAGHHLHVLAVDLDGTVYRQVTLDKPKSAYADLRLVTGFSPDEHVSEQKNISIVQTGEAFKLDDITTAKFEAYDSLPRVYQMLSTLSEDAHLTTFAFAMKWPELSRAEKEKTYSEYACHELNFFIYKKDPEFFKVAIRPYLEHKKDKTFLDHFLLEADLTRYLNPYAYGKLNIVERILLGRRLAAEGPHAERHVIDLFNLIPPNIERFNELYGTAIKGSELDTGDSFGMEAAKDAMREIQLADVELLEFEETDEGFGDDADVVVLSAATRGEKARKPQKQNMPAKPLALSVAGKMTGEVRSKNKKRAFKQDRERARRQFYQQLEKTKEWVENNYYKLPPESQKADLITVNAFWRDFAAHQEGPFFSTHVAEASRNFPEMMFALAVLDLPFAAEKHEPNYDQAKFTLKAASPMLIYHQEILGAEVSDQKAPILVSQNAYRHGDRYTHVNNERIDKFVTEEFLVHVVYGCQVVLTNPTSSRQKLDVLAQLPHGAIPVLSSDYTSGQHIVLEPYGTTTFDYYFYFPEAGKYGQFPVHVAKNEKIIAAAQPFVFNVVKQLTKIDKTSWDYVSQHGSNDDVLAYMRTHNVQRLQLGKIAFRMRDVGMFQQVTALLRQRHRYDNLLWSYAIQHNRLPALTEYLEHSENYLRLCGMYLKSTPLTIDAVARGGYLHMEYDPIVNARQHQLGAKRQILNDRMYAQYERLMKYLSYRPTLTHEDRLAVSYYLFLQDRIDEALTHFAKVERAQIAEKMQYDYVSAYAAFYQEDVARATTIATRYAEHPVPRWRNAFVAVKRQAAEIEGATVGVTDAENRDQQQAQLAATEPDFELEIKDENILLRHRNLDEAQVNFYAMDLELLFSRNPFVQHRGGQFAYIQPNSSETLKLAVPQDKTTAALPEAFRKQNVMVEVVAAGKRKSAPYFANQMNVQVVENYGQIAVVDKANGKPVTKAYVKVYARNQNGQVEFYKDGYTDLRGRFDFTSLSTNQLDRVKRFAILVMSDGHGALVREAAPPKR